MPNYTISNISVPGAASTSANGINDQGEIVGNYETSTGQEYGFLETSAGFVTISVPGAASTAANGINDLGQIVGTFVDSTGVEHGFLDTGGTISTIDVPGAVGTDPMAINDSGQIVGSFLSPTNTNDPNAVGPAVNAFEDNGGTFTTLAAGENDGVRGIRQPYADGINNSGEIVGTTQLAPGGLPTAWTYVGGTMEALPEPSGADGYGAAGISNNGQIAGWYGVPNTTVPGGAAFIDTGGTLTLASLPGAPNAINDAGQIVGNADGVGFLATPDAAAASDPAPCFCAGTGIATVQGNVVVEALRPGDRVLTASGNVATVRWVGQRSVKPRGHANPDSLLPVRFAAHAVADGVPQRDVWLSPDHAVFIDGMLVPAHRLANGATISRDATRARVTYVHVELDRHDVLLADGLAAESYLDTGNRGQFERECGVRPLRDARPPDPLAATLAAYAERGCAPLHLDGAAVTQVHRRLLLRAEALGWTWTDDPALRVTADGRTLRPVSATAEETAYKLPPGVREVGIRSRCFVPSEVDAPQPDGRRLGMPLVLRLDGRVPAATAYADGWHDREAGHAWRWTDGHARLLLSPGPACRHLVLRHMACGARYWLAPRDGATSLAVRGRAAAVR